MDMDEPGTPFSQPSKQQTGSKLSWQSMVAGVKSRVMSDEMMRGIRHCLEWLQVCQEFNFIFDFYIICLLDDCSLLYAILKNR